MEEAQYRISPRQLQRMIILETGSIGCLFVTVWSGYQNGILTVLFSIIASLIYGGILMAIGRTDGGFFAITERSLSGFLWRIVWGIYMIRFAIRGAWILSYLEYLIRETLFDGSRLMIILPLLVICVYASVRTLVGRARFVELLFWWMMVPLVLLFLTGLWKADLHMAAPIQDIRISELLSGEYRLMALFLPLEFLLFRMSALEGKNQQAWVSGMKGILFAGLWLLLVYCVTIGIIGPDWGHDTLLGVTDAMELITVRGGGLERLDILLILFWLIGGIITLSAYIFQGQQLWKRIVSDRSHSLLSVIPMVLVTLAVYYCFADAETWSDWYVSYACMIDLPLSIVLPVLIWCIYKLRYAKTQRKTMETEPSVKEFVKQGAAGKSYERGKEK